jgi:hypothetical protein
MAKSISVFRVFRTMVLLACVACEYGCGRAYFIAGGQRFNTAAEANVRLQEMRSAARQAVTPLAKPLAARAVVALPTDREIANSHVRITGNSAALSTEQLDFTRKYVSDEFLFLAEMIQKRAIFREATVERLDDVETVPAQKGDFVVLCDVDGWTLKKTATGGRKRAIFDLSKNDYTLRIQSFLDSLETAAAALSLDGPR